MRFVDANIFIRFLMNDDEMKARASAALFLRMRDEDEVVFTTESIIAEVFYVLAGRTYKRPREQIAAALRPILTIANLRLENRKRLLDVLDLIESFPSLDFEDCLSVVRMQEEGVTEVYSYDREFDRIPGLTRIEPALT